MRPSTHRRAICIVSAILAAAALQAGAVGSASALTPAAYRAQLNGLCRSNTPTIHAINADLNRAVKAKDGFTIGADLGKLLLINLRQDARIEAIPVPVAMRTQMAAIFRVLRQIDSHARLGIAKAANRDSAGLLAELDTIGRIAKPLNGQLDRAGLRDCGSNQ